MGTFTPSKYQQDVFTWIETGKGHAVIKAVPGSGKSTTLLQASKLPSIQRVSKAVFLAFNVAIKDELQAKLTEMGSRMKAMTINGFGFSAVRKTFGNEKFNVQDKRDSTKGVQANKYYSICKNYLIANNAYDYDRLKKFQKLVSLARMTLTPLTEDALWSLSEHYDLEFERHGEKRQEWEVIYKGISEVVAAGLLQVFVGQDTSKVSSHKMEAIQPVLTAFLKQREVSQEMVQQAIDATATEKGLIDFDDQVFLPLLWNLSPEKMDFIFIDESQDLNAARLELILRAVNGTGRLLFVGDENQSIYGFSGADTNSMNNIIKRTNATVLPLSICYRCPSSHIKLCADIVPGLEAAPNAPEGLVGYIHPYQLEDVVQEGDLILCRIKAPLVSTCLSLIRSGKRAKVRGTDIGAKLVKDVQKLNKSKKGKITVATLRDFLSDYRREQAVFIGIGPESELELAELDDKVDTINALCDAYCSEYTDEATWNMESLYAYMENFFSDERGEIIVLSTVHKAKGLEENRVFILQPEKMPHPKAKPGWQYTQEMNIKYVAYSRAKFDTKTGKQGELYFVTESAPLREENTPELPPILTLEEDEDTAEIAPLLLETVLEVPEVLEPINDTPVLQEPSESLVNALKAMKSAAGKKGGKGVKRGKVQRNVKFSEENNAFLKSLVAQGKDTSEFIDRLVSLYREVQTPARDALEV